MTATAHGSALAEFATLAGLALGEQLRVLDEICSVDVDGKWSHREYVVRCGGEVLDARALAGLFLFGEEAILWVCSSAGEAKASFRRIAALVESSPELRRGVAKIRYSNGEQRIELRNGCRLLVASPLGARGIAADTLLVDGLLNSEQEMSVLPTLLSAANPQRVQRI